VIDPPFRSPRERVGGLFYFGRMLDKIRCHLLDELPEEYRPNFGVGLDGTLCGMLGVAHADLIERMRSDGSDEEILEWCYARGTRLNGVQVHIWNEFARKVGWNDRVAQFLSKVKGEDGITAETADLSTAFEVIDYREGRAQKP
jgi:gluconokinase